MVYAEWNPRRFHVEVKDPDGSTRWVVVKAAVGPIDAANQAKFDWPFAEVIEAREAAEEESA